LQFYWLCALRQGLLYGACGLQDSASRRLYGWAELDGLGDDAAVTELDRNHSRHYRLRADMSGLPSTCIVAVASDPLRDDSLALAEFCQERGVPHRLEMYEGVLHCLLPYSAVKPLALRATEDGVAFLLAL
jgi:acetyl esterase